MKSTIRLHSIAENIKLTDITQCNDEIIEALRILRNLTVIRENMYTSHIITEAEHKNWVLGLKKNPSNLFFAVSLDNAVVGGASFNNIDIINKRAEWAFYLDPNIQGKGLGAGLEYKMLNYAFDKLNLNKLDCEVLEFNTSVISMHKRFGFKEEGVRRERLIRNNKKINAILLGITAREWKEINNK